MFLLWILFVIYVSCLSCFLVCSLQPCGHLLGKGWPLGSLVCDVVFLCVFLSLSHVVSWVRCGTWLYRFLIFASLLTLHQQQQTNFCTMSFLSWVIRIRWLDIELLEYLNAYKAMTSTLDSHLNVNVINLVKTLKANFTQITNDIKCIAVCIVTVQLCTSTHWWLLGSGW